MHLAIHSSGLSPDCGAGIGDAHAIAAIEEMPGVSIAPVVVIGAESQP